MLQHNSLLLLAIYELVIYELVIDELVLASSQFHSLLLNRDYSLIVRNKSCLRLGFAR